MSGDRIEFYCERHRKPHRVVAYMRTTSFGSRPVPWKVDQSFAPAKARARADAKRAALAAEPRPSGMTSAESARWRILHSVPEPGTDILDLAPLIPPFMEPDGTFSSELRRVFLNPCDRCGFSVKRREEHMYPLLDVLAEQGISSTSLQFLAAVAERWDEAHQQDK